MHIWGIVSGCASCAVRLCVCEKSDGWLVAWGLCECMLMRSPMVWLLTFTVTSSSWLAGIPTGSVWMCCRFGWIGSCGASLESLWSTATYRTGAV